MGQYAYKYTQVLRSLTTCIFILIAHRVRLVDGPNPHTGRVEVYTNSTGGLDDAQWGTICDDNWNFLNARVVCRQLGYPDAVDAPRSSHYGPGTGKIWLNNVECTGTEPDLFTCNNDGIGTHSCGHLEDASVECLGVTDNLGGWLRIA